MSLDVYSQDGMITERARKKNQKKGVECVYVVFIVSDICTSIDVHLSAWNNWNNIEESVKMVNFQEEVWKTNGLGRKWFLSS